MTNWYKFILIKNCSTVFFSFTFTLSHEPFSRIIIFSKLLDFFGNHVNAFFFFVWNNKLHCVHATLFSMSYKIRFLLINNTVFKWALDYIILHLNVPLWNKSINDMIACDWKIFAHPLIMWSSWTHVEALETILAN